MIICQDSMAEHWFTGKVLSLANGMNLVVMMVGGLLASLVGPEIYEKSRDLNKVVFCMCLVGFLVWLLSLVYNMVEDKLTTIESKNDQNLSV